jgi:uncharacterized membrane protein YbaN (DUF454 family)
MNKHMWVIGGTVCIGLGILGIFLPVLPTTPFFLLAAFCYGRGSKSFYRWLVNRSLLGAYIRSYREGRGIPLKQKLLTLALLWLTIGFTIGFVDTTWWLKALLLVVAAGVTIHLIKINTRPQESPGSVDQVNSMESVKVS